MSVKSDLVMVRNYMRQKKAGGVYFWRVDNGYVDDSVVLEYTPGKKFDPEKIAKAVEDANVSILLCDSKFKKKQMQELQDLMPDVTVRGYEKRHIIYRELRKEGYLVENPVIDQDGTLLRPFKAEHFSMLSDYDSAKKAAKDVLTGSPGKMIYWSSYAPTSVIVNYFNTHTFDHPITYMECCTQYGESFRYVAEHIPEGSEMYAVDFSQKVWNFPVPCAEERGIKVHRIPFKGNEGYHEAVLHLLKTNPDLRFDVCFYDAAHNSTDDRTLEAFKDVSRTLIVDDVDIPATLDMANRVMGDLPYRLYRSEQSVNKLSRIYDLQV